MGKPHPIELRERFVAFVEASHTRRLATEHFRVSPRFVNDMMNLKGETGSSLPKRQGNPGVGKLSNHKEWVRQPMAEDGEATLANCVSTWLNGV